MPYRWTEPTQTEPARLTLWPHRSLPRRGFVGFIAVTAALLTLPLLPQLGTPGLWMLLPFLLAALAGLWLALERSYRDGQITEELTLTPDLLTLTHRRRGQSPRDWSGNPYWTRPTLYPSGGPVPQYLTLKGSGKEVELGAFLSEDERLSLKDDLAARLARLSVPASLAEP